MPDPLSAYQNVLLDTARASIEHGLAHGRPLTVAAHRYPGLLQQPGACFITLQRDGQLRGCIGSLEPRRALIEDVAENAFAAAFRDPRFLPLEAAELAQLDVSISVLTTPEPLNFVSEADLLQQLVPGIDGLIVEEGPCRGTFLPSVWEQLPQREDFWRQLKRKAGLPADYWSPKMRVLRYRTLTLPSHSRNS